MAIAPLDSLYIAFAMLSLVASLLLLLLFVLIKPLRVEPGSLILGQSLSQLVLDLHWFTFFLDKGTNLCKALGAIGLLTFVAAFNYAVAVGAMMSWEADLYLVRRRRKWLYHLTCWFLAVVIVVPVGVLGDTGHSIMGTCFVTQHSNAEFVILLVLIVHTPLSLFFCAYAWFCRNLKEAGNPSLVTLVFSLTWFGSCISHFLSWHLIMGNPPTGLPEFAKVFGTLSGLITVLPRLLQKKVRAAVYRDKPQDPLISTEVNSEMEVQ